MVTSADKLRYDAMFKQADKDADGLVSGMNKFERLLQWFEEADWDPDSSATCIFGDFKEISEYPKSSVLFTFWQKGEIAENLW